MYSIQIMATKKNCREFHNNGDTEATMELSDERKIKCQKSSY